MTLSPPREDGDGAVVTELPEELVEFMPDYSDSEVEEDQDLYEFRPLSTMYKVGSAIDIPSNSDLAKVKGKSNYEIIRSKSEGVLFETSDNFEGRHMSGGEKGKFFYLKPWEKKGLDLMIIQA